MTRRGLVLGAGGTLGGTWERATLAAVEQALDWDTREAEVLIGTSIGSTLVAKLGSGVSVEDLLGAETHVARGASPAEARSAAPGAPSKRPSSPRLVLAAVRRKDRLQLALALSGLLPAGRHPGEDLYDVADRLVEPGAWVGHPATWIVATDLETGRRRVFGHPSSAPAALRDAVRASCAVPGFYAPALVDGRRYVDGAVASVASVDLVAGLGLDEVVVLSPMTSSTPRPGGRLGGDEIVRRALRRVLDAEIAAVTAAGVRVIRVEPTAEDMEAIGPRFADASRRARVLDTAMRTASASVAAAVDAALVSTGSTTPPADQKGAA